MLPAQILAAVPSPYQKVSIASRAAYVLDGKTGKELWNFNGDVQLPLASLTKIMMAVTALSLIPENTIITINPAFLETEGDSGLYGNERWLFNDLLDLTLLESSNDGANAIAVVAGARGREDVSESIGRERFVSAMNNKAKELGLKQTYFLNPTGLDESDDVSGGYGSARDMAALFSYSIHTYPTLLEATRHRVREFTSLSSFKHKVKNTNALVGSFSSLIGSKTGYTDLAGGNLVLAFDAGLDHPIIISVLGSTEKGRFEDVEKLVYATLSSLASSP
ncbi:MAG: hypothetical protein Q7S86_02580 [bacterium]|nr:hypothetical protein [bacterium]